MSRKRRARRDRREQQRNASRRLPIQLLIVLGGAAALSWTTLWQLEAALSIGVSAFGAAITLATTMAGMTAGSLLMGRWLSARSLRQPILTYGLLELAIGVMGLLMRPGFRLVESLDTQVYAASPGAAPAVHLLGIAAVLGIPSLAMGATVPVFQRVAAACGAPISRLYALNTVGAAMGTVGVAFWLIPNLGVAGAAWATAAINGTLAGLALLLQRDVGAIETRAEEPSAPAAAPHLTAGAYGVVFATGFATFALEVIWFRSLLAAFQSTSESFAVMLVAVLVPLAIGAGLAPRLARRKLSPATLLGFAGAVVLFITPLVERIDMLTPRGLLRPDVDYVLLMLRWLGLALLVLGPAILMIGTALPLYLDRAAHAAEAGRIYAINTLGAVAGSLLASWVLIPNLGAARSSWLIGVFLIAVTLAAVPLPRLRIALSLAGLAAIAVAVTQTASIGRDRIQTSHTFSDYEIIAFEEGPDSTVSVVETRADKRRRLVIDGFTASSEKDGAHTHYMAWMGRLPMLLHPDPRRGLVIAFGTGQTASALLDEGPEHLDVVELSPSVLRMAPYFTSNEGVLEKPKVDAVVMDGRAWVRRVEHEYDVITLEPMPPYFRGVNALYSREFYQLAAERLSDDGVFTQWLPYHLVAPDDARSVTRTFLEVFPDSVLWLDPEGGTGILLGRKQRGATELGSEWPGLQSANPRRTLPADIIKISAVLTGETLHQYAATGEVITDSNQLLAYGMGRGKLRGGTRDTTYDRNMKEVESFWRAAGGGKR